MLLLKIVLNYIFSDYKIVFFSDYKKQIILTAESL